MRRGRDVLLLLNGDLRGPAAVRALARRADAVLCADGGARHARALGLVPDAVVGDMDSLPRPLPRAWGGVSFVCDFDQSRSDLDKALDLAGRMGARRILVAGALGGGLGHELVNLAVLEERAGAAEIVLVGGGTARLLGPGRHVLALRRGRRFSLLAAPRARVTLSGARYPLMNGQVLRRGSRGLGNRAEGRVALQVLSGRVWLVVDAPGRPTPRSARPAA
ncbi:MAG: thiamine diphosphokinase [Elusimicrobia bacterium]|nr:thiamine diphosphokinase [Elusimicrobiota bacterium]